ncbi:sugar ABC transporter ATP-binding protein, partial [Candidatus Aerophobetes bacterium]|nr:sugar ABC transporter ATP-binding protein [Candidatus Aerophobetes bacterium]
KKVNIVSPRDAVALGIGFIPEERRMQGLILKMCVRENVSISKLDRISKLGVIDKEIEKREVLSYIEKLNIKTPTMEQEVVNLSGGNQQKVILARWLTLNPKILIMDEPTRGIDVGTKAEIHSLIRQLANQGTGIILISSELPEILNLSDRIIVVCKGSISAELSREEATQEKIMMYAAGVRKK